MNYYQKAIKDITGAKSEADILQTEELMRSKFGTLNHLSNYEFWKETTEAYKCVQWMKTPEGMAYMEELEREIMGA